MKNFDDALTLQRPFVTPSSTAATQLPTTAPVPSGKSTPPTTLPALSSIRWRESPTPCVPCEYTLYFVVYHCTANFPVSEYRDRNPQYQWMLDTLSLRGVQVWDFARMNFIRTLLSKRKLTKLVESGVVWGWDDPRFPTIRGIRRRGMTIPALREFILKQGPSKAVTLFDWALSKSNSYFSYLEVYVY